MVNSKKKAMTKAKPSKTHKNSQAGPHIHKRKLVEEEGEDEDSDSSNSQTEPPSKSHKKYARGSRDDNLAMVHDVDDVELEHVSDNDEVPSSLPYCYTKVNK